MRSFFVCTVIILNAVAALGNDGSLDCGLLFGDAPEKRTQLLKAYEWIVASSIYEQQPHSALEIIPQGALSISTLYFTIDSESFAAPHFSARARELARDSTLQIHFVTRIGLVALISKTGRSHAGLAAAIPPGAIVLGGTRAQFNKGVWEWVNSAHFSHLPGEKVQEMFFPIKLVIMN